MQCSLTSSIALLQLIRWLVSRTNSQQISAAVLRITTIIINGKKKSTCGLAVGVEDLAEDQFVGVKVEWVSEHAYRDQEHVTVGAFGLVCAGAIKVPARKI